MSDSVRPHRRQPTRLPRPWDSPGKNTGVGCHFLLQCMKVKSESEAAQSCPTLSDQTFVELQACFTETSLTEYLLPCHLCHYTIPHSLPKHTLLLFNLVCHLEMRQV